MTPFGFLLLLLIAAVCGGAGQAIAGYSRGGCLVAIVFGFVGAWVGMWLAGLLGLPEIFSLNIQGQPFPIVWSVIGAALVAVVFGLISRGRARR